MEDYTDKNTFHHKASDSFYSMIKRDGKLYQRRYQIDFTGQPVNVMEKQVDFIMGSGNHARTYLHRTGRDTLIELPLGWYSEKGGYWAMNPGYDRPDHMGFRRLISYDCMFCHNGYPKIPAGNEQPFSEPVYSGSLPEGIDCQRCHGPGRQHAQLASNLHGQAAAALKDIRRSIVNPARLSPERQMEVCMTCHLESTSFPLPNAIQRYGRGPFSYRPGEPLSAFILNFDQAAGKGRENKFEIVSAAYRLRRSACFLKSNGRLLCTTCHNQHDVLRGEAATQHYTAVCRQCHASVLDRSVASGNHPRSADCVGCHMPKRRTEDVVHASVTDHQIQRRKPAGDLLADMPERHETDSTAYRGPVTLYYPKELPHTPENDLYLAVAQVKQRSNLSDGIEQLAAALERYRPGRAEYYFELAEAWRDKGDLGKALPLYRESIRRDPEFVVGMQKLGFSLRRSGQNAEAADVLKRAAGIAPDSAATWLELGLTYQEQSNQADAVAAFERAVALDPDMSEARNNLGVIRFSSGEVARAEAAFREAIRIQPDYADAHGNLGALLMNTRKTGTVSSAPPEGQASSSPDGPRAAAPFALFSGTDALSEALYHFEIALRLRPEDVRTRYGYAVALGRNRRFDEAQRELEEALRTDPGFVEAQMLLGDLLMAKGQAQAALAHYREAVRIQPESGRAQLGLGSALASVGDVGGAIPHLQKAAADLDSTVREEAAQMLRQVAR